MNERYTQIPIEATGELTISRKTAYSGDQRTIMPDVTPIDVRPGAPSPEGSSAIPFEQRQGAFPVDDAQRMIRLLQLTMASQAGEAGDVAPNGPDWEALKKIPQGELKGVTDALQALMLNYSTADIRDPVFQPLEDDPHPNDPYSAPPEEQLKRFLEYNNVQDKNQRELSQVRDGKYLDGIEIEEISAANPREEVYRALQGPESEKAEAKRQLEAFEKMKNALLEIKRREMDGYPLSIRELKSYLAGVMGYRGQSGITMDDNMRRIVERFTMNGIEKTSKYIERGMYGERELKDEEIDLIKDPHGDDQALDRLFNRIFEKADRDQSVEFTEALESAGRQEWTDFKSALDEAFKTESNPYLEDENISNYLQTQGIQTPTRDQIIEERKERIKKYQKRRLQYSAEHDVRETTHNANYVVLTGAGIQEMQKYTSRFRNSYADMAFRKRGVMEAYRYYNQALLRVRSKYGGYLPQSAMIVNPGSGKRLSEVDELAYSMFQDALAKGVVRDPSNFSSLTYFDPESGQESPRANQMEDWEIDRAFGMARGLGIMMGTTIEVAAQSIIPPENTIVSLYARPIVEKLQIFQTIQKYDIGGAKNSLFAMFLNKDKKWTRKEFQEFYDLMHHEDPRAFAIMNGLIEEDHDRLSRKFNVFGLGGLVSRTAWRAGHDPIAGAMGALTKEDLDWVGSGLLIEKNRGALKGHHSHDAEHTIEHQLERMKELQPLVLYQKMPKVQDAVLRNLFGQELQDLGIEHLNNRAEFENKYNSTYLNEGVIQSALKGKEDYKNGGEFTARVDGLIKKIDELVVSLSVRQDATLKRRDHKIEDTAHDKTVSKRIYDLPRTPGRVETTTFAGMGPMSQMEQAFIDSARSAFDEKEYLEILKSKDYRQPYILDVTGMDMQEIFWQVPGEDTMARRWGDHSAAENGAAAVTAFMKNLSHYHSPQDLIKPLEEIYTAVSDYDAGFATQLVMDLVEASTKFYSKDWFYRLPGGVGNVLGLSKGWKQGQSFAQAVMGTESMAWDELEVDRFMKDIRKVKLLTGENVDKVRNQTIAKKGKVLAAYARFFIPVVAAGIVFYIMKQATEDSF